MEYLLLKWTHILSSTILFGTGIGSAFYMFMANRRKDIASIYFATCHVVIADWLFTSPAIVIQFITGLLLLRITGFTMLDGWVMWGLLLYCFVGACWLPVVWMQIKMRDLAKHALDSGQTLPTQYWQMEKWWIALGSVAFPTMVLIFYLMVVKP